MLYADALSRCPTEHQKTYEEEEVKIVKTLPMKDSATEHIKRVAENDIEYQQLQKLVQGGWPEANKKLLPSVAEFFPFRNKLTIERGLVLKGDAVMLPKTLRKFRVEKVCFVQMSPEKATERAR